MGAMGVQMSKTAAKVDGIQVLLDVDIQRTLHLLMEGQQALSERMPEPEQYQVLETRVSALEMAVKHHSWELQQLRHA